MIRVDLWEESLETLANANRTTTRTASAMRGGEGFVEIDVHDIEAHIARTTYAKHRVEVGTIVVHECATIVDELGNLRSKSPRVFGLVIIMAATLSSSKPLRSSTSTMPLAVLLTSTISNPQTAAEAGFVP